MSNQRITQVIVSVVALLALAACGGGGGDAASAGTAESGGGSEQSVTIQDNAFDPAEVSVAAGGSVVWTNNDAVPHTVTFDDDAVTSSDELSEGDDFSATFDQAGEYSYVCAIHPEMKGKVTVS